MLVKVRRKLGNGRQTNMSSFYIIVNMYMHPLTGEWDVVYTVGLNYE